MRVIVTNFNPHFTGVSATIATLFPFLAKKHELYLCGKPLAGAPAPISFTQAIRLSRGLDPVIWHVRRNNEMLHALFVRDVLRLPIKIIFTSAAQRLHSAVPRLLISKMDAVIATTNEASGFVKKVAVVAPHGVDIGRFVPASDRAIAWRSLGFGGGRGIATVGRVRPEKGTDRFVDMAIELLPSVPDVIAIIVGKATAEHQAFQAALETKIHAAGLATRILFIGEQPASAIPHLMSGLSLLVAAPRYEGYGLTPLEAMACCVPVIASDVGYFSTFVDEGKTGHIVPDGDPGKMAAIAASILQNPERLMTMGIAARQRVEQMFSAAQEADAISSVYETVFNSTTAQS
jgi:mannosyltransferase